MKCEACDGSGFAAGSIGFPCGVCEGTGEDISHCHVCEEQSKELSRCEGCGRLACPECCVGITTTNMVDFPFCKMCEELGGE